MLTPFPKFPDTGNEFADALLTPIFRVLSGLYNTINTDLGLRALLASEYGTYNGKISSIFAPYRNHSAVLPAYEALTYGQIVAIFSDSGTVKVKKAVGGPGGVAGHGYVKTLSANPAEPVEVALFSGIIQITGVVIGTVYYLNTTAGQIVSVAPGSGVIQKVGVGIDTNLLYFSPDIM